MAEVSNLQSTTAEMRESQYSKMVYMELWNFMSFSYARVAFDDSNIINIKGYNDSGKSAILRALDVLFFNVKPNSQIGFIHDDCDYFRVMVYFDDGISILRDKYINGQGLYEMYKDGKTIFTTKQNNVLTRITGVPEPIQQYLGLITSDAWNINSRSCFQKQLLVETTGSENHKSLNEVLRSEEIAIAGEFLNTDKNKLGSDINIDERELEIYKNQIKGSVGVSQEFLDELRSLDENLDLADVKLSSLASCQTTIENIKILPDIPEMPLVDNKQISDLIVICDAVGKLNAIPNIPEFSVVDSSKLSILGTLKSSLNRLNSIPDIPELSVVDTSRLSVLTSLKTALTQLDKIPSIPKIEAIDFSRLDLLLKLKGVLLQSQTNQRQYENLTEELDNIKQDIAVCQEKLAELGHKYVVCQECGAYVPIGHEC